LIKLAINLMNLIIEIAEFYDRIDRFDDVGVLRRSVIEMRGGGIEGRAVVGVVVGVVVAIAPQLQWVVVECSGKF